MCSRDARRQLACIARHGLNVCQIRGPKCAEGYRLGYYALQLRDTWVLLRNVHFPFEGPSERAKLEQLVILTPSLVGALVITCSCPV